MTNLLRIKYNMLVVVDKITELNAVSRTTFLPLRYGVGFFGVFMTIELNCKYCGKTFKVSPSRKKVRKCCSSECRMLSRIKWDFIVFRGVRYILTVHGYYNRRKGGIRTLLHRDKWEYYRGPIPKGYFVHHKNHNNLDNRMCNLALMEPGEHTRHHLTRKVERKSDGS